MHSTWSCTALSRSTGLPSHIEAGSLLSSKRAFRMRRVVLTYSDAGITGELLLPMLHCVQARKTLGPREREAT